MEESASEIEYLRTVYSRARNRYRPQAMSVLMIAEAPPCALDRFFYFEDVKKQDSLFLEIMGVLYPDQKKRYLASGRKTVLKEDLLRQFQSDGYWLLSLCEVPTSISGDPSPADVQALLERLTKVIDRKVSIILIQAGVYDVCYGPLQSNGYNVIDVRMPFPGSGQQRVFREKFLTAMQACG